MQINPHSLLAEALAYSVGYQTSTASDPPYERLESSQPGTQHLARLELTGIDTPLHFPQHSSEVLVR